MTDKPIQLSPQTTWLLAILSYFILITSITSVMIIIETGQSFFRISLWGLALIGLVIIFLKFPRCLSVQTNHEPVKIFRRLFAFLIDMMVLAIFTYGIGMTVAPFWSYLSMPLHWTIEFGLIISFYAIVFCIFWQAFKKHIQTPGQFAMQFRVVAIDGKAPKFAKRVLFGVIAYAFNWMTLLICMGVKDGVYWWDRRSNTRAISTRN